MSKDVCWTRLTAWIALAAYLEKTRIREIDERRDDNGPLSPGFDVGGPKLQSAAALNVKLACIKECAKVSLLLLLRLIRDDNWEEDVDLDAIETSSVGSNSLKTEDISLQNIDVEIQCPEGYGCADQDFVELEVSRTGCILNGVKLDMNQIEVIVDNVSNVDFSQPLKSIPLTRTHFMKSRHQFLQQLGLLFFQLFSRGESIPNPSATEVDENRNCTLSTFDDEDHINDASKMMRRMNLDVYKKKLLVADVPESICRVVTDLIHSGMYDEDISFLSLIDVFQELLGIVSERPDILFYKPDVSNVERNTNKGKIDFGNVVYGREVETNRILELAASRYDPFKNRLILIGGNGGEGKSFMVEGVKNHLVNSSGWIHVGIKFERLMYNSPLSAISSAFEVFFASLLGRDDQETYLAVITVALQLFLSPSLIVLLCNLIPSLRRLFPVIMQRVISEDDLEALAEESDGEEQNTFNEILSDTESSRNRLHYSFRRLVHAISSFGRPLLLVFDDLQWASQESLDLITSLMAEWAPVHFAEVALTQTYSFKAAATMEVHTILLHHMTKKACNSMISNALQLPNRLTRPLADIVHAKTSGNVFYIKVFVESLVINKTLTYSLSERRWNWHLDAVKAISITKNVAQLMKRNLQILPEITIWALMLLSCLGSKTDESLLMLLADHIDMIEVLAVAIDRNIIEKQGQVYRFSHDILEQSVYDMMSRQEQNNTHLFIGLELLAKSNEFQTSHSRPVMHIAIDQINRAKTLGNSQLYYSDRYADLNLKAAESSMSVFDFASALSYSEHGISFLADHVWDDYKLSLRLYETASKACFASSQGDKMRGFLNEIFEHAPRLQDKLSSCLLLIETLGLTGNEKHAIDSAFSLLEELGESSPQDVPPHAVSNEYLETKKALRTYTDSDIKNVPRVSDWNISARMRVLGTILPFLFTDRPQYLPYVACRIVNLSLRHGLCSDSPLGLVVYAVSLLNTDIDEAYRLGKLGLSLHETFDSKEKHPRLKCAVYGFLAFYREPLQSVVDLLKNNYRDSLMAGDGYVACSSVSYHTRFRMMCGHSLSDLDNECKIFVTEMTKLSDPSVCLVHLGMSEVIRKLSGSRRIPFSLMPCQNIATDEDYLQKLESLGMSSMLQAGYFNALFVNFWFKKYDEAASWAKKYRCRNQNRFLDVYHSFYEGMTAFQLARKTVNRNAIEVGHLAISLFQEWVKHSTWNFQNKLLLLQAELQFFEGNKEGAIEKYQAAIKTAQESGFIHEGGLAFELLGSLYLHYGDVDQAKLQMNNAHKCYEKWGALAIVELCASAKTDL
ncbi:hypothetical protein HJC23_001107 [Cyclotella cryptica]|uniref:Orc1-like AAA ATPase domain-containing protein n=1 Tax=Cyclotella cryptica TaxID=29204 RepID=A0ABD3QL43_9STRA